MRALVDHLGAPMLSGEHRRGRGPKPRLAIDVCFGAFRQP